MDGTLLALPVDWEKTRAELRKSTRTSQSFSPIFESVKELLQETPSSRDRIFEVLKGNEMEAVQGARLYGHSRELLTLLSSSAPLALVTLQGRDTLEALFHKFDLGQFFSVVVTREDSLERAAQLSLVLTKKGIEPGEAIFVADRLNDLRASAVVGIPMIMVHKEKPNDKLSPYRSYPSLKELFLAFSRGEFPLRGQD
jgi:phosphoglycolate phosphatase-like HAD superfamily hydrolase